MVVCLQKSPSDFCPFGCLVGAVQPVLYQIPLISSNLSPILVYMARGRRHYHKRGPFHFKLKKQTVNTVAAIWIWLFALAITLSFFGEGTVLTRLREELILHLGWGMYPLPILLVSLSLLFFKIKSDAAKPNVPSGMFITLLSLIGITQTGIVGEILWSNVANAISAEGALLIYLGVLLIGLIILFNTSLDHFVSFVLSVFSTVGKFLGDFFRNLQRKNAPLNRQLKINTHDDERPLVKSPIIPPPVPGAKPTATAPMANKSSIMIPAATNSEDMKLWEYPSLSLLSEGPGHKADRGDVKKIAQTIENLLDSFGVNAKVVEVNTGPAVTQYALQVPLGIKVSKITSLSQDLARATAAPTGQVRVEAPIPGRDLVGVEIPNRGLEFVTLKKMLLSEQMQKAKSKLSVALGLDVSGEAVIADIGKMPHVLVAGTTGSGKSVLINSWICSILFRTTPQEVRLIMVDPKRVELTGYNGIPHLLTPVIVEQDKILSALRWSIGEMENRYKQFAQVGVRNIDSFNELSGFQALPYIIIFIDELADLMAYAPAEVEDSICRLAQMARATGIHLVVATQRPSVDVITGLIKANIPARIAFNVSSMIDSRVIIDTPGAEKLLGRGDMLFIPPDQSKPARIQGTFVSEQEVNKVVEFFRTKSTPVQYTEEVINQPVGMLKKGGGLIDGGKDGRDALFVDALRLVCQYNKASSSLLQRRLSIGYARAARIMDQLEDAGVIGPEEGSKPRDVLIKNPEDFLNQQNSPES